MRNIAIFMMGWLFCFPARALPSVTVMADATLNAALAEIARDYSQDYGTTVNASFAPPNVQAAQIAEGAAADILITPKESWIEQLKTQGLIDIHSETVVTKNRLALVGPIDSPLHPRLAEKFPTAALIRAMNGEGGFVVGNPEDLEEGVYGKEALRHLGVAGDLEPYTLYIKELPQMFDMVANHQSYGLFFYSTTLSHPGIRVLDLLPQSAYHPINYFAVVIAGENMDEARKFLDYLKSLQARQVFRENGFGLD